MPKIQKKAGNLIFVFFLALYFLTNQGTIQSSDGMIMFSLTKNIIENHVLYINNDNNENDGRRQNIQYSKFGLGMSILAIPFYLTGKGLSFMLSVDSDFATKFCVSMLNAVITAITCMMVFKFAANRFLFSIKTSTVLAMAYGLSTIACVYSEDFMSEPATTLFIFCAVYFLADFSNPKKKFMVSGFFIGLAVLCRMTAIVAVPAFLVYLYAVRGKIPRAGTAEPVVTYLAKFIFPQIIFALIIFFYNYVRFSNILETGYEIDFSTSFLTGLYGLLLSPGKSIFLYDPVLIAGLVGFFFMLQSHREMGVLFGLLVLSQLVLYSPWHSWMGGMGWGPRFLLIVIPYMLLPVGFLLEGKGGSFLKGFIIFTIIVGVAIQIPAVTVNFSRYYYHIRHDLKQDAMEKLYFDPKYSPLRGQFDEMKIVLKNSFDKEFMHNLVEQAKLKKNFIGAGDKEVLENGLALNAPNFWWYYLYLFGFPFYFTFLPVILFFMILFFCGIKIYRLLLIDSVRAGMKTTQRCQ